MTVLCTMVLNLLSVFWRMQSWEDPAVEVRGQFAGHYMSAAALWCNHTGARPHSKNLYEYKHRSSFARSSYTLQASRDLDGVDVRHSNHVERSPIEAQSFMGHLGRSQ